MVRLLGIDLAWTARNESGVCVVEGDGDAWRVLGLGAAVLRTGALVHLCAGPRTVAAVDAPLVIGPGRAAEPALGRRFGRYNASAHSANYELLTSTARDAGSRLAIALAACGWSTDPSPPARPARWALEVYPHSCHVSWFNLPERIKYKPKWGVTQRRLGLAELQSRLDTILAAEMPSVAADPRVAALLREPPGPLRGRALKHLEDQLDALTCLLAAFYAWRDGVAECEVFGDAATGYIAVPGLHRDARDDLHPVGCAHPHQT